MKITYNWLKEYVDFKYTPYQLAEHLTMLGLEVELVVPVKPSFKGVVVGKILEISPHPNAEKLLVCTVTTGEEPLTIVCGAHNIQVGDKVPTAVIGAILANTTKITKRAIKGINSSGMLCSEQELGLTDSGYGIFILSKENLRGKIAKIGKPLEDVLALNDTILDISITPNRADALSVIGIAREISALTKKPLKKPKIQFLQTGKSTKKLIKVNVKDKKLCPRYTARIITDLEIKPSPFWLRYRLNLVGTRAINNVVDVTNYVLLEFGQPLHAFDYQLLSEDTVIIRKAYRGEKIITIDNEPKSLDKDMLVIADKQKPVAVAGIIGGKDTEVTDNTHNILLESAYFNPANTRRTSKKLGISTSSSFRFERGLDPELAPRASDRATQLILDIAGGHASRGLIDCTKDIPKLPVIRFKPSFCNRILGTNISPVKISKILKSLGCKVISARSPYKTRLCLNVKPPSFRCDLTKPIDLVEEVARLFGYPNIPFSMPEAEVISCAKEELHDLLSSLQVLLTGLRLNEIITYSFIAPDDLSKLRIPHRNYIRLKNPVSQETSIMRTTLIPGLVKTILHNLNNGNDSLSIFEIGKCFYPQQKNTFPRENLCLAIGLTGHIQPGNWSNKEKEVDFFFLKGILEEIMDKLTIRKYHFSPCNDPILHPGRACNIKINNKEIGIFGQLHPAVVNNYGITQRIYIASLDIKPLVEARELPRKFVHLSKYPQIRRDISIIVDNNTASYDIIKTVRETGIDIIESIKVFDLYSGESIPKGKKSLTYAVNYRHKERTLTDKEVENIHNIVRQKILEKIPGIQIRE